MSVRVIGKLKDTLHYRIRNTRCLKYNLKVVRWDHFMSYKIWVTTNILRFPRSLEFSPLCCGLAGSTDISTVTRTRCGGRHSGRRKSLGLTRNYFCGHIDAIVALESDFVEWPISLTACSWTCVNNLLFSMHLFQFTFLCILVCPETACVHFM